MDYLGNKVINTILFLILANLLYLLAAYQILKPRPFLSAKWILGVGIVLRLAVWPLFPTFSDDVFRYRWEGQVQASGANPYQVRPIDPAFSYIRDAAWPHVGTKDFKAAYGPLLELEELGVYRLLSRFVADPFAQVFWFKFPGALFELGCLGVLLALLRARNFPDRHILLYAWSPLPIFEFWVNGHNDSIPIFFILLALLGAAHQRWIASFLALSVAVATKIWPILLFPAFILSRAGGKPRWWQWLVVFPLFAVCALPYWGNVVENAEFASGFIGGWRNNDSLFGGLLWLAGGDLYRAKYTASALIIAVTFLIARRATTLERAVLWTFAATLIISANCHPWYLTWFAPMLAFVPYPPLLLWQALMPVCYSVLLRWNILGEWDGSTSIRWLVWIPVFAYLPISAILEASQPDDK
jgi:alpha-1,6-mannosyltransferase